MKLTLLKLLFAIKPIFVFVFLPARAKENKQKSTAIHHMTLSINILLNTNKYATCTGTRDMSLSPRVVVNGMMLNP